MSKLYPCSLRQIEDWHYNYILPRKRGANIIEVRFHHKNFNEDALRYSLIKLIETHSALRTCFPKVDGRIVQDVTDFTTGCLKFTVLVISNETAHNEIIARKRAIAGRMRNLQSVPLVEAVLYSRSSGISEFIIFIHHIIADMTSLKILESDFKKFYKGAKKGIKDAKNENKPVQLCDYITSNQESSEQRHLIVTNYWQHTLGDKTWHLDLLTVHNYLFSRTSTIPLKTKSFSYKKDYTETELIRCPKGESLTIAMPENITRQLINFQKKHRNTMANILLTSLHLLGWQVTKNKHVVIQTHFSNRYKPDSFGIVGNLIGKLILYSVVDDKLTFNQLIKNNYLQFLRSAQKIILNSEKLKNLDLPTKSFLFFNYINNDINVNQSVVVDPLPQSHNVESPLVCHFIDSGESMVMHWLYHLYFYDIDLIKALTNNFFELLETLLSNSDLPIRELIAAT